MEVVSLNRRFLKLFGMYLDDDIASEKERCISKWVNWAMLTISVCTVAISIEYISSHFDDTESILYAVIQVVANTASGGGYWTFYKKKHQVSQFFDKIECLVRARKTFIYIFNRCRFNLIYFKPQVFARIQIRMTYTHELRKNQRSSQNGHSSFSL